MWISEHRAVVGTGATGHPVEHVVLPVAGAGDAAEGSPGCWRGSARFPDRLAVLVERELIQDQIA